MSLNKKQIKAEAIDLAGEIIDVANEFEADVYNEGRLSDELMEHVIAHDDVCDEFEHQVNVILARHYAKYAGGKFVPNFIPPKGGK